MDALWLIKDFRFSEECVRVFVCVCVCVCVCGLVAVVVVGGTSNA
jgi:hypothetical protein